MVPVSESVRPGSLVNNFLPILETFLTLCRLYAISTVYIMTNEEIELIAKPVKDMYGTSMGTVLGTITEIDGSIQTVGIDCGSAGLQQIPYEQLVVQGDVVIFIPKWRLDSQRLIREKGLALRRLKALVDIVSENDDMKDDAETIREKYQAKLASLDEFEQEIKGKLDARLTELDIQIKAVKTVKFDARVQYKSNEMTQSSFELASRQSTNLIEHLTHETAEIANVQRRIADLDMEIQQTCGASPQPLQDSAATYLAKNSVETTLPEAPTTQPIPELSNLDSTQDIPEPSPMAETSNTEESDWLSRMEAQ